MTATPSVAPPKQPGSGPWIGAIVVMLLLMGGMLAWRFAMKRPEAEASPASSAPPPVEHVFEAPPPPPPEPEEPDAGTPEEQKARAGFAAAKPVKNPCAKDCTGDATGALRGALQGRAGQARSCYERALLQDATLQGQIRVAVRVGETGAVCSASIASNSMGNASVANCVLSKFRSGVFPPPKGGCVDTVVPINFVPRNK